MIAFANESSTKAGSRRVNGLLFSVFRIEGTSGAGFGIGAGWPPACAAIWLRSFTNLTQTHRDTHAQRPKARPVQKYAYRKLSKLWNTSLFTRHSHQQAKSVEELVPQFGITLPNFAQSAGTNVSAKLISLPQYSVRFCSCPLQLRTLGGAVDRPVLLVSQGPSSLSASMIPAAVGRLHDS